MSGRLAKKAELTKTDLFIDGEKFPWAFSDDDITIKPNRAGFHYLTLTLVIDGPVVSMVPPPED
jgi:hypothetical protein